MAGRAAVLQLYPLSARETPKVSLLRGGYPEAVARPAGARLWFASYLQTYLERDVRAVTAVKDLATFRRFLALLASRHGQVLNKTDLAAPLGVSVPTITQWLGVLETTAQILIVSPFYENLGKRLIKSPKLYFADSRLACHLLGIDSSDGTGEVAVRRSVVRGLPRLRDCQGAGERWQASGAILLPRPTRPRSGFHDDICDNCVAPTRLDSPNHAMNKCTAYRLTMKRRHTP